MIKRLLVFVAIVTSFVFTSCKEEPKKEVSRDKTVSADSLSNEGSTQEIAQSEKKYYVIAPSGLSLRKENNLQSEKLMGMLLGSEVTLLEEAATNDIEVENIKGGMHKVSQNGQTGYAFSGYLSAIHLPAKDQTTEDYITSLKKEFPSIRFESKRNDPDFHEGVTDTFTLPAKSWHEAFYIVWAMYKLPNSLNFPNPTGPDETVIEDPKKPKEAWSSDIVITRKDKALEKIQYGYRAEGFGYGVTITKPTEEGFSVEYLGFVD